MCAINGVTKVDYELVERMNVATKHRGPDGSQIYSGTQFTFGHNRLAIIDLSPAGAQPRVSNDGRYVIVFNGEIYNYRELREELQSQYNFVSQTDTEVLLAAYSVWGESMLNRLRGIFAFALYDNHTETLILVRDHTGVKPLYYSVVGGALYFSSELSGLIVGTGQRTINTEALTTYLGIQYVPSPASLVSGISKLRPGHLLQWKNGQVDFIKRYFEPDYSKRSVSSQEIYQTIGTAVARQLVSDRPVGAFISGGLDSSIVLHHMSQSSKNVQTFSVGYEMVAGAESEAAKFNADSVLAARTAKHYGATHHNFDISLSDIRQSLESILGSVDEPVANPTVVAQYFLSRWVREVGVVVALGGDGGDELFGGYTRHRAMVSAKLFQYCPRWSWPHLVKLNPRFKKMVNDLPLGLHQELMVTPDSKIKNLFRSNIDLKENFQANFSWRYQELPQRPTAIDAFMQVDRETWLPEESLARSDRTSMASGLELRVPLLDLDVVNLADQISIWKKTWPHEGKRCLRRAYRHQLPDYLFNQPKRGWFSPGAKWLRDPKINQWSQEVLSSNYYNGLDSLFNWPEVQKMLTDHTNRQGYYLYPLWNIIALQVWARKNSLKI
jgi:asparagine synthase (glutamine-hydrolysing)